MQVWRRCIPGCCKTTCSYTSSITAIGGGSCRRLHVNVLHDGTDAPQQRLVHRPHAVAGFEYSTRRCVGDADDDGSSLKENSFVVIILFRSASSRQCLRLRSHHICNSSLTSSSCCAWLVFAEQRRVRQVAVRACVSRSRLCGHVDIHWRQVAAKGNHQRLLQPRRNSRRAPDQGERAREAQRDIVAS